MALSACMSRVCGGATVRCGRAGDNVSQCFYRVAADLAGVVLTKPELEVASKVVKAEIVNHPQDDANAPGGAGLSGRPSKQRGACLVQ
jgi:hypothetical protein